MPLSQDQAVAAGTGATDLTSVALTLPAAATAGRVLVAAVVVDKAAGSFTLPSGWTRAVADITGSDVSMMLIHRTAAGGETGVSITWSTAARFAGGWIGELSGVTLTGALASSANSGSSNVTSQSTGSVTATGAGDAIAILGVDSCSAFGGVSGQPTWTNSFTRQAGQDSISVPGADVGFPGWSVALRSVSAGSVSSTPSWGSGDQAAAAVLVLPASGGGGGSPPATPTGVAAAPLSASSIRVSWSASSGATSYLVERSPNGTSGWATVAASHGASPFDDTGLSPATTYHYRVSATNADGTSSPSSVVSATTNAAGSSITYPAGTTWQWTEADWQYVERIGTLNVTATAGVAYVGLSRDSLTYDWFAGPLSATGRLTLIGSGALGSAAETSARAAAVAMPTSSGLWEIPPVYQARFIRLGHRHTSASYGLREFFPRRLVEADDMRAEFLKARHIGAGTIVGDHIFGTTLAALKAELGIVTLGTGGGLWQGAGTFAAPTTGLRIWNDAGRGRLASYNGGIIQVELDTTGALAAGAGAIRLNQQGLRINAGAGAPPSTFQWERAGGEVIAEQYAADYGTYNDYASRVITTPSRPRARYEIAAGASHALILDTGGGGASAEAVLRGPGNVVLDATGSTLTVSNSGTTVSSALTAAQLTTVGASNAVWVTDRVNTANRWAMYSTSNVLRLYYQPNAADRMTLDGGGNAGFTGTVTAAQFNVASQHLLSSTGTAYHAGNVGVRTAVDAAIALTINGTGGGTGTFGLAVRTNTGVNNFFVRDDGAVFMPRLRVAPASPAAGEIYVDGSGVVRRG